MHFNHNLPCQYPNLQFFIAHKLFVSFPYPMTTIEYAVSTIQYPVSSIYHLNHHQTTTPQITIVHTAQYLKTAIRKNFTGIIGGYKAAGINIGQINNIYCPTNGGHILEVRHPYS